jgi:hypothetical protein
LTSCFPATLLRNFLNDFEMFAIASNVIGITLVSKFHMRSICVDKFFIFESSLLLFDHILSLLKFQHILINTFTFHYHGL